MSAQVLFVSTDLMFSSRLVGAGARQGAHVTTVAAGEAVSKAGAHDRLDLVIVDLSTAGAGIGGLIDGLKNSRAKPKIVAYGPHVHEGKLEEAQSAGCDEVLTRGQFDGRMDEILASVVEE